MNGRVYDYNLGRFLSVDPFIQEPGNSQSMNPYSYIMNNPLAGTDPSGYMAEKDVDYFYRPKMQAQSGCGSSDFFCKVAESNMGEGFKGLDDNGNDKASNVTLLGKKPSVTIAPDEIALGEDNGNVESPSGTTISSEFSDTEVKELNANISESKTLLSDLIKGVDAGKLTEKQKSFAEKKFGFDLGKVTKNDLAKIRLRAESTLLSLNASNFVKATEANIKQYYSDVGEKYKKEGIIEGGAFVFASDPKHRVFIAPGFFDSKHNSSQGRVKLVIHEASHFHSKLLSGTKHPSLFPFDPGPRDRFINDAYRFASFVTKR